MRLRALTSQPVAVCTSGTIVIFGIDVPNNYHSENDLYFHDFVWTAIIVIGCRCGHVSDDNLGYLSISKCGVNRRHLSIFLE